MSLIPLVPAHAVNEGDVLPARRPEGEWLITRQNGMLRIWSARCPHAGYSLLNGRVRDGAIQCPGHGLVFDLVTGRCRNSGADCSALSGCVPQYDATHIGVRV